MIDISLLNQLATFAKYGTLSAAAEKLHTSQPALTRSMKKLESDLGVSLFIRSKNHLELNEVGVRAAKYAQDVLGADADFESKVRAYDRSLHTISIGYCAPVPQSVLTPIINNVFDGMTISADMSDDADFIDRIKAHEYHLAVLHKKSDDEDIFYKKCGHEDLYISLTPGDPLTFYPEIHLKDLDGRSMLLYTRIGFWSAMVSDKTPNVNFLLQMDRSSFNELRENSSYPSFTSSYFKRRDRAADGKVIVPIADPECHTDYYLACLASEKDRYRALFDQVTERTIL